jgi:hypothetical protein
MVWQRWRRSRELARIDTELSALEQPHVRVAPATLEEAMARIEEREQMAEAEATEEAEIGRRQA